MSQNVPKTKKSPLTHSRKSEEEGSVEEPSKTFCPNEAENQGLAGSYRLKEN